MSHYFDNLTILDRLAVKKYRDYLKIPTVHPDVDYEPCITFLEKYAHDLEIPIKVYRNYPNKPIAVLQWFGKEPELSTVLLNGHMDVAPVLEKKWTYKPFGAQIDGKGNIYARGAQGMKCNSIQYLEAIRRLRIDEFVPKRTMFVFFVPDKEVGDVVLRSFVKTKEFQSMNIGFGLDGGDPSPKNEYIVYSREKSDCGYQHMKDQNLKYAASANLTQLKDIVNGKTGIEHKDQIDQKQNADLGNHRYVDAIKKITKKGRVETNVQTILNTADCHCLLEIGLPTIGVSPIRNTTPLIQNHNECLSIKSFLEGLQFYYELILELGNI